MTTRRERTSHESRELILTAASELFAEKGYRRTTFVDVAERSGISRGSIPWHFDSKEGLLLAVFERAVTLIRTGLDAPPREGGDGSDRLARSADALFSLPATRLFVTLLAEALEPDSPIRERYVELHDTLREHCRRGLERLSPPDGTSTEALAVAIIGAGIGIHQQWLLAPDRVDPRAALAALRPLMAGMAGMAPPAGS